MIVSFYSVPNKDDWGSLFKGLAEKGVEQSVEIQVETIDLASIFDQHGVPYYLKCDLEGGDRIFIEQLLADQRRPAFVSVEISGGSELEMLGKCGYELAQVINQAFSWQKTPPNPAREGSYAEVSFTHEHSGLFGRELDPARWMPIAEALEVIRMWNELKMHCPDLVPGWADVHVCKPAALA